MKGSAKEYSPAEFAKLVSVGRRTVYHWIEVRLIRAYRVGLRKLRIPEGELSRIRRPVTRKQPAKGGK